VLVTVLLAVLITEIVLLPSLPTYTVDPSRADHHRLRAGTYRIVAVTVLVAVLITDTVLEPKLVT
jgi:hypothetical protein